LTKLVTAILKVAKKTSALYSPNKPTKITALGAKGSSFSVRFSQKSTSATSDVFLTDNANLNTTIYLDGDTDLLFDNGGNRDAVGFVCGEELE
jgi:hypothetical protein